MPQLSDHARDLLARLYTQPTWRERLLNRRPGVNEAVLEKLVSCGEPGVIPHLAPLLFSDTPATAQAGARVVEALLLQLSSAELAWLDEVMRDSGSWITGEPSRRLAPRELARWVGPGEPGILLLRLSSFHHNGFVREEALRRLALIRDGSELPYLLLRMNDWAGPVRRVAREAVLDRITDDYADHFVRNMALLARLERAKRADHAVFLDQVSRLLAGPAARGALIEAMRSGSREVRRTSFRFLFTGRPDHLEQLLAAGLQVADPLIRLWCARVAIDSLSREQLLPLLDRLVADPFAMIRRLAPLCRARLRSSRSGPSLGSPAPQLIQIGTLQERLRAGSRYLAPS